MISARANPLTGSVLVQYREGDEDLTQLLAPMLRGEHPTKAPPFAPACCPECRQTIRTPEASAVPNLVRLTGSILTGDVVGVMWWLLSASFESRAETPSFASAP